MGEYWKPVNVTRREYIHPLDLGDGQDLGIGLGHGVGPDENSKMVRFMAERWPGASDQILLVSNYGGSMLLRGEPVIPPAYDQLDMQGYKRISRGGGS
jgi:hypothetical protein